jgi:hypothetical protein
MLFFTNREPDAGTGATPAVDGFFTRRFDPGADTLALADVQAAAGGFTLSAAASGIDDDAAMQRLVPLFRGPRPVLVYLHGFDNPPRDAFERCARLQALYDVEVVGFSWPGDGYQASGDEPARLPAPLAGSTAGLAELTADNRREGWALRLQRLYRQAKLNAIESGDALARFLRLVAAARLYVNQQRLTVAAHSLGAHFLKHSVETEGSAEALGAAQNIALLAPCCRAAGHASWVGSLAPRGRVYVTFNERDAVLWGARLTDKNEVKLGSDPGDRLVSPRVRYVSFTDAPVNANGHRYFVEGPGGGRPHKNARKLFGRILAGDSDLQPGEPERKVYPLGCDADGATCWMAKPDDPSAGG